MEFQSWRKQVIPLAGSILISRNTAAGSRPESPGMCAGRLQGSGGPGWRAYSILQRLVGIA